MSSTPVDISSPCAFTVPTCCREADAAAAAAEEERQKAEQEAQLQAEEERAAREAGKRELRRLERKFTLRMLGRVEVARPAKVDYQIF